jgi:2-oxoacid:acceptor oxidoreductase delta subunit (pyruvate/2-ketoisovalerate family)
VLKAGCVSCGRCALLCPDAAASLAGKLVEFDLELCKGCGICARECPKGAIEMEEESQ